jgi:hypothetical protein
MVTLPTEASLNYSLVSSLLEKGMTCERYGAHARTSKKKFSRLRALHW